MGRTAGIRNHDYEETRHALAEKVLEAVLREGGAPSLQSVARTCEVSIPTLKHYFGDRSTAVAEALRAVGLSAEVHFASIADPGRRGLRSSLTKLATDLSAAWEPAGVGRLFTAGMAAGLFDPVAGPGYLDGVLEPTVRALERRLRIHASRGQADLDPDDELGLRTAALAFLAPVLVALMHQHALSGAKCRPLPMGHFLARHVARFVRGYGPSRKAKLR